MRKIDDAASLAVATKAFQARLGRYGVAPREALIASAVSMLGAATDRAGVMAWASAIEATFRKNGVICSKSCVLEAIAAYLGVQNWATLNTTLKKSAVKPKAGEAPVAPYNPAIGTEQEDVLHKLTWVDMGHVVREDVGADEWAYHWSNNSAPDDRRVHVRISSPPIVQVLEGSGLEQCQLARWEVFGGQAAVTWAANEMAFEWMIGNKAWVASHDTRSEAATELKNRGFLIKDTGGWCLLLEMEREGTLFSIGPREDIPIRGLVLSDTVFLETWDGESVDRPFTVCSLAQALEAVDAALSPAKSISP